MATYLSKQRTDPIRCESQGSSSSSLRPSNLEQSSFSNSVLAASKQSFAPDQRPGKCGNRLFVNAAFLQEIKDSNPMFWQILLELRRVCHDNSDSRSVSSKLVRLLDEFRDALAMQFALEECYGYLEVVSDAADPPFDDEVEWLRNESVQRVRAQHSALYLELSELAETAEEYQYRGYATGKLAELIVMTRRFDRHFRQHEDDENELIERSFGAF